MFRIISKINVKSLLNSSHNMLNARIPPFVYKPKTRTISTGFRFSSKKSDAEKENKRKISEMFSQRNKYFMTPERAMQEFLLKRSDLKGLRNFKRRGMFSTTETIVLLRSEVENRAQEIWGNSVEFNKGQKKRSEDLSDSDDAAMDDCSATVVRVDIEPAEKARNEKLIRSTKIAIVLHSVKCGIKLGTCIVTGSHCMFAEAVHSFGDIFDQTVFYSGLKLSSQKANFYHPYGFYKLVFISSLISGTGICFFDTGVLLYHGISGLLNTYELKSIHWAFLVLSGSLIIDVHSSYGTYNEIKQYAKENQQSVTDYISTNQTLSRNILLLEKLISVIGLSIATSFLSLSVYLNDVKYDSIGCIIIGSLIGSSALYVIYLNSSALAGRSIPAYHVIRITKFLENDPMVRAVYNVIATDMGNDRVHYKAQIDFDGRELTKVYILNQGLDNLSEEAKGLDTDEEVKSFLFKHGENVVQLMGTEIDRIENIIKSTFPEVKYVNLEVA